VTLGMPGLTLDCLFFILGDSGSAWTDSRLHEGGLG